MSSGNEIVDQESALASRRVEMCVRTLLSLLLMVTGSLALSHTLAKRFSWPAVADTQRSYSFPDASKAKLTMIVPSVSGHSLYLLRCANTDLDGEGEVMPGDFACWLKATDPAIVSRIGPENLLTPSPFHGSRFDESHSDVYDRESVWAWQFAGKCGDYPDFGRERVFRLRGMKLTLTFRNEKISPRNDDLDAALKSFDLSVSVQRDKSAITAIAAPSPFEAPAGDEHGCDSVKPNDEDHAQVPSRYPVIRTTEFDFNFPVQTPAPDGPRKSHTPDWTYSVLAEDGRLAYEFSCRVDEGTSEGSTPTIVPGPRYAKEGIGIVNSGIWCRLLEPGTKRPNLLDLTLDPYSRTSRAEIFPDQLKAACADYPDWGRERSFRLRGMKLTMAVDGIKFGRAQRDLEGLPTPDLIGARIHVSIVPDSSATTPAPEHAKYADWSLLPTSCNNPVINPLFPGSTP